LPKLIIAPYSFFFIPYSESVPTFSSPDSRFPHHRSAEKVEARNPVDFIRLYAPAPMFAQIDYRALFLLLYSLFRIGADFFITELQVPPSLSG
jgi:hypothetical protein